MEQQEQKKDQPRAATLIEKMKQTLMHQKRDLPEQTAPTLSLRTCPNCGAGRAKGDGLTHCAYCNFAFIQPSITDGIHLKKTDNSPS